MHEMISLIVLQASMIWRRRWYVLAVTWLVCLGGWIFVALLPDTYASSARVYVDTNSLLRPLLRGLAVDTNPERELQIMQRTLLSRPNMEKVARMTDLDLTVKGPAEMEKLIERLQNRINIRSETTDLFSIEFEHPDPQMARRVVQALLTIYVESNLGSSRAEMDSARRFIDEQIRQYERQLDEAEHRLAEFKKRNAGLMPGNTGYYQRLEGAQAQLAAERARLADAIAKRRELKRQLASVPRFIQTGAQGLSGGPPSDLQVRILELQKAIDEMLTRYTPKHPDVVTAQRRLDQLRKELQEEMAAPGPGPEEAAGGGEKVSNPVYEQLKLQLVTLESDIATLRGAVARAKAKVAEIKQLADRVPAIEAELSKLNRDYDVIKSNYEQLLARREAAKISEDRETKGEKAVFRIIDPPQLPTIPSGPPRILYLSAVLLVGIGSGIAFGAALANLRQAFYTVARLKQAFAVPVLGAVSLALSPTQKSWRVLGVACFCLVSLALFAVYGGLIAVETSVGLPNAVPADLVAQVSNGWNGLVQ